MIEILCKTRCSMYDPILAFTLAIVFGAPEIKFLYSYVKVE